MDRNTELKYGAIDTIEMHRSKWDRTFTHKTSFNAGYLIPFFLDMDIIPGSTIKNRTSIVCRMATPTVPVMDNLYIDTYYFKCSKFWYWEHWRAMMGENELGAWAQEIEYTEPKIAITGENSVGADDVANYIGVRQNTKNLKFSKIAISAYIDLWNQWFRDQNLQAPIQLDKTDADLTFSSTDITTGGGLLPVQKFHDYFTSALPEPQKGAAVNIPLGTEAPIITNPNDPDNQTRITLIGNDNNYTGMLQAGTGGTRVGTQIITTQGSYLQYENLKQEWKTDLTDAVAATVNAMRLNFAVQKIRETDARLGTRYREIMRHYGSTPADESILTPEYLGGTRQAINITTVLQNSSTNETSPLGETGAMSVTALINDDFTKSFSKDDILIGVMCVRADHTYQQGLPRQLTRERRLDRYWPELSHIGNQPIYNYEIFAQGTSEDNEVFGYKEAWQEYIHKNNRISGMLNSDHAQSLDYWHFGDDYTNLPVLSDEWIREPQTFIDRALAVTSETAHQFWADIYVEQTVVAPIPLNRQPGLIDHF